MSLSGGNDERNPPPEGFERTNASISTAIQPMDWRELADRTPPARDWAIDHWLGMGHTTLLAGPGGAGKSLLSQIMASALCLGVPYFGATTRARRVLIWACEDDEEEIWRRQVRIAEYFGVELADFSDNDRLIIMPRAGRENTLRTKQGWLPLWAELEEQVCDYKADILFLDNVGQTCADEIDRHNVTAFVNGFSGIGRRANLKTAAILLAHPAKAAGSEFSGSTAWETAVRMRWYFGPRLPDQKDFEEAVDDSERFLCKRKTNYSAKDFHKFTYDNGILLPDAAGPTVTPQDFKMRQRHAEGVLLRSLLALQSMGKTPTDGHTSPEYLPKLIVDFKLSESLTKQELAAAMRGLMVLGKLKRAEVGKYGNRGVRFGLVAT